MTFAEKAIRFYKNLALREKLPKGVELMNPYLIPEVARNVSVFLKRFFSDNRKRVFVFGINPGRFGAGITGVTFTDPVALENFCGIPNDLPKRRESSSIFIYDFVKLWNGPKKFYRDFFLTAVSPLGFVKDGKNYNFYDHPMLLKKIEPFLVNSIKSQIAFGARPDTAIVLGTGKNKKIFEILNKEHKFFKQVYFLEHPRFIMQYRRKEHKDYLQKYLRTFKKSYKINL